MRKQSQEFTAERQKRKTKDNKRKQKCIGEDWKTAASVAVLIAGVTAPGVDAAGVSVAASELFQAVFLETSEG